VRRKFGKFGESSVIRQTKTIQISTYNYNLLAESIHSPNFFCQMLKMSKFTKLFHRQTFPLYSRLFWLQKCMQNYLPVIVTVAVL